MSRLVIFLAVIWVTACTRAEAPSSPASDDPTRIVSLDYCADQFVLKFADRDQILAISPDANKYFSYMRDHANGVPTVRAIAEDVLILKPDLVVRSYGGGSNATAFFERAGIPVLQVGWASTIDGDTPGAIPHIIQSMADGLGQTEKGQAVIRDYRARLSDLQSTASHKQTLYMARSGVSTGEGTLVHEMMIAAGLQNYAERSGWHDLPLEKLALKRPEMVAATFFEGPGDASYRWSASRHPIAQRELEGANLVPLEGAWTSCGGWYILEAIEALSLGAK